MNKLPWYKEGLRFECTQCGKCCTGAPGVVWVNEEEIAAIADYLKMPLPLFKRKYLRQRDNRYALIELKSQNNDCIFLKDNKCSVYPVRPGQCRTYPWWKENLNSEQSWLLAAQTCEGIRQEAPLVPFEVIQNQLDPAN